MLGNGLVHVVSLVLLLSGQVAQEGGLNVVDGVSIRLLVDLGVQPEPADWKDGRRLLGGAGVEQGGGALVINWRRK